MIQEASKIEELNKIKEELNQKYKEYNEKLEK